MSRRHRKYGGHPVGRDSSGRLGLRHYNKYAPKQSRPVLWCNAKDSLGQFCGLAGGHSGPHVFASGGRR